MSFALVFPGKKFVIIQMVCPDVEHAEHDSDWMAVSEQMVLTEQDFLSSAVHPAASADSTAVADEAAAHLDSAAEDAVADFPADDLLVHLAVRLD